MGLLKLECYPHGVWQLSSGLESTELLDSESTQLFRGAALVTFVAALTVGMQVAGSCTCVRQSSVSGGRLVRISRANDSWQLLPTGSAGSNENQTHILYNGNAMLLRLSYRSLAAPTNSAPQCRSRPRITHYVGLADSAFAGSRSRMGLTSSRTPSMSIWRRSTERSTPISRPSTRPTHHARPTTDKITNAFNPRIAPNSAVMAVPPQRKPLHPAVHPAQPRSHQTTALPRLYPKAIDRFGSRPNSARCQIRRTLAQDAVTGENDNWPPTFTRFVPAESALRVRSSAPSLTRSQAPAQRIGLPVGVGALGHPDDVNQRYIPLNLVDHAVPANPDSPRNVRTDHSPASWRLRIAGQALYVRVNAPLVAPWKPSQLPACRTMPLDFVAHR